MKKKNNSLIYVAIAVLSILLIFGVVILVFDPFSFFKKDNWELIEDYDNYELSEEKLHESQFDSVKRLYFNEGVSSIEKLSKIVEDPYSLGMIVAKLGLSINEEKNIILNNLDKRNYMIEHPGSNPFIDSTAWKKYLGNKKKELMLLEEKERN